MTGRPSTYTEEMGEKFCQRLACGESLRAICADPEMPSADAIYKWLNRFPSFAERYARARSSQTEAMLEDMLAIADDPRLDPQEKRVRIDTRKWAMSKLNARKYGDVTKLEHSGPDGQPLEVSGTVGLAIAAVQELRALRMDKGELPAPPKAIEGAVTIEGGEELL